MLANMIRSVIKERDRYPVPVKPRKLVILHTRAIPIKENEHTVAPRHQKKLLLGGRDHTKL